MSIFSVLFSNLNRSVRQVDLNIFLVWKIILSWKKYFWVEKNIFELRKIFLSWEKYFRQVGLNIFDLNYWTLKKYLRKYSFEASFSNLNWPDIICGSHGSLFKSHHQYRSASQRARSDHNIFYFCGTWHLIWLKKLKIGKYIWSQLSFTWSKCTFCW